MKKILALTLLTITSIALAKTAPKPTSYHSLKTVSKMQQITIGGRHLSYMVTAGLIPIKNSRGKTLATMSYVAYNKLGVKNQRKRPISFLFNGGPGAPSLDINFLGTGPKIAHLTAKGGARTYPGTLITNPDTWLRFTDEVYIDVAGSGWGRVFCKKDRKKFWSVKGDGKAFATFIHNYLKQNNRWNSPIFIGGESYGGMRAPEIVKYLATDYQIPIAGLVLISPYLNAFSTYAINAVNNIRGYNLPYILNIPTITAVAIYHHKLAPQLLKHPLATINAAKKWALQHYWWDLANGANLTKTQKQQLLANLVKYTGLPPYFIKQHNYRISLSLYRRSLLQQQHKLLGTLDGRFTMYKLSSAGMEEPFLSYAMFNQVSWSRNSPAMNFFYQTLEIKTDIPYISGAAIPFKNWQWSPKPTEVAPPQVIWVLHDDMVANPRMKVFIASGYYDLTIPFLAQEYDINQLLLPTKITKNITHKLFWAGHMMYIKQKSREILSAAVENFYN